MNELIYTSKKVENKGRGREVLRSCREKEERGRGCASLGGEDVSGRGMALHFGEGYMRTMSNTSIHMFSHLHPHSRRDRMKVATSSVISIFLTLGN